MHELCKTCGVGYYLPSGVCDHCNSLKNMSTVHKSIIDNARQEQAEERFIQGWRSLALRIYAIGKASGFYDHAHTEPGFNHAEKLALMHSELSEALEGLRAGPFPGKPDDKLTHRPMVEAELADTIIRIMNYASHCGLDVAGAVVEKAAFNATRGHRHGGKRF